MLSPSTDRNESKAHQALSLLIKQEADRYGVLSFARFMELALYTPGLGFYERSEKVIGRCGDFFTSVSVGQLFGELLACQFSDWIEKNAFKKPAIVESGAHDGQLAKDVLVGLESTAESVFSELEYWIVEPSDTRKAWQHETLKNYAEKVRWVHSWTELSSFRDSEGHPLEGVLFCNELLDAMPVHRLQWSKASNEWQELGVTCGGGGLQLHQMPFSEEIRRFGETTEWLTQNGDALLFWPGIPKPLLDALPDGFVTDVCPAALKWWQTAAKALNRGWLLTLDYGLFAEEFFTPRRAEGTVRGYQNHRFTDDVLATPGGQDITASVNFSAIERAGVSAGLKTGQLESQSRFLTKIASDLWSQKKSPFSPEQIRQFQTLTHPNHMGRAFKVLVQSRNISSEH